MIEAPGIQVELLLEDDGAGDPRIVAPRLGPVLFVFRPEPIGDSVTWSIVHERALETMAGADTCEMTPS